MHPKRNADGAKQKLPFFGLPTLNLSCVTHLHHKLLCPLVFHAPKIFTVSFISNIKYVKVMTVFPVINLSHFSSIV